MNQDDTSQPAGFWAWLLERNPDPKPLDNPFTREDWRRLWRQLVHNIKQQQEDA